MSRRALVNVRSELNSGTQFNFPINSRMHLLNPSLASILLLEIFSNIIFDVHTTPAPSYTHTHTHKRVQQNISLLLFLIHYSYHHHHHHKLFHLSVLCINLMTWPDPFFFTILLLFSHDTNRDKLLERLPALP